MTTDVTLEVKIAIAELLGAKTEDDKRAAEQRHKDHIDAVIWAFERMIEADPSIPKAEKEILIAELRSGQAGGRIANVLQNVRTKIKDEVAEAVAETAQYAAYVNTASAMYPDYNNYSAEAKRFIVRQLDIAMETSIMKSLSAQVESLAPEERESARKQMRENFADWEAAKADPEFVQRLGPAGISIVDNFKLQRHPQFNDWLEKAKSGEIETAELLRQAAAMAAQQIEIGNKVRDHIMPQLDKTTQAALKAEFGDEVNMSKFIQDWNKISFKERDTAFRKLELADGDISSLTKEELRTVTMAKLAIATDAAQTLSGTFSMAKDKSKLAMLTNDKLLAGERVAAIQEFMRANGQMGVDQAMRDKMAGEIIELIDTNPKAKKLFEDGKMAEFGVLLKVHVTQEEQARRSAAGGGKGVWDTSLQFAASSYHDAAVRPYHRDQFTAEELATRDAEWKAIEDKKWNKAQDIVSQHLAGKSQPTAAEIAAMKPEQRELYSQAVAVAQQTAQALGDGNDIVGGVNTPPAPVVAATAVVAPPGINLKDIPSLGALGVTGDGIKLLQGEKDATIKTAKVPEQSQPLVG